MKSRTSRPPVTTNYVGISRMANSNWRMTLTLRGTNTTTREHLFLCKEDYTIYENSHFSPVKCTCSGQCGVSWCIDGSLNRAIRQGISWLRPPCSGNVIAPEKKIKKQTPLSLFLPIINSKNNNVSLVDTCSICKMSTLVDPERTILCDGCNDEFHFNCYVPVINFLPEGDWFCRLCVRT